MNALKVVAFVVLGLLGFAGVLAAVVLAVGLLSAVGPFIFVSALAYFAYSLIRAFVSKPKHFVRTFASKPERISAEKLTAADIDEKILAGMRLRFPGKFELLGDFYRLKRDFETHSALDEEWRQLRGVDESIERERFSLLSEYHDYDYSEILESVKQRLSRRPESAKESEQDIFLKMMLISSAYPPEVWDCFERLKIELEAPKVR